MFPLIIAEGLVVARRALAAYNTLTLLLGSDPEEIDKTLRITTLDDEEIYFYLLTKGLFTFISNSTSASSPSDQNICRLVDSVLVSRLYSSSADNVDDKSHAFCTTMAKMLVNSSTNMKESVKDAFESMKAQRKVPMLVEVSAQDKSFVPHLIDYLKAYRYEPKSVASVVDLIRLGKGHTSKQLDYQSSLSTTNVSISESWIGQIAANIMIADRSRAKLHASSTPGKLTFHTGCLVQTVLEDELRPLRDQWRINNTISKEDIDRYRYVQQRTEGATYDPETKIWIPSNITPPLPKEDKPSKIGKSIERIVTKVAEGFIEDRLTKGLSNFRFLKRTEVVKELSNTQSI